MLRKRAGGRMNISNNNFASIQQIQNQILQNNKPKKQQTEQQNSNSFNQILEEKKTAVINSELKFSKHANQRLSSRNIDLSGEQIERLEHGANKAREKGITESLVMVDNLAFIVNIKNNTVITAVNDTEDTVFTNIDGAVIM